MKIKFHRDRLGDWGNPEDECIYFCKKGLDKLFEIPETTFEITMELSEKALNKQSIKAKFSTRWDDIQCLTLDSEWKSCKTPVWADELVQDKIGYDKEFFVTVFI